MYGGLGIGKRKFMVVGHVKAELFIFCGSVQATSAVQQTCATIYDFLFKKMDIFFIWYLDGT
jgi:hypothetical protein